MSKTPLKRHPGLQALSREHHQGLILALNVDKGVKKRVEFSRIAKYIKVHFDELLVPHFQFEEREVFTFLPKPNECRKGAELQHSEIRKVVEELKILGDCSLFADLLRKHIRFEERELFELIQEHVDSEELDQLNGKWEENLSCVSWEDRFWE